MIPTAATLAVLASAAPGGITERMMLLALQLGVILVVAKLAGELFERALKQPAVLGELLAGIAIGPFGLGQLVVPGLGIALFPAPAEGAALPVSAELWAIAQLASIVLLFVVGLETDFRMFLRYAGPGLLVGLGGVAGAFVLGSWLPVAFGRAPSFMHPEALFMGTISVATSVGITARILSEKRQLDSPEGTTILAGAVIDDVLGIIVLAIVGGIATAAAAAGGSGDAGAAVDWSAIGGIAARAVGFWLGATALFLFLAATIARALGLLRAHGAPAALALGIALLTAGIAERAGLAMIIGAYIVGLGLSKEPVAKDLIEQLHPLYAVLVPVFFCVVGMVVDLRASGAALGFGVAYSLVAVVSKVVACGLPTLLVGFNLRGALRVGLGMLPRGEVALIVAGAALAHDPPYIGKDMFGVAILMTLATTLLAPPLLVRSFATGGSGLRARPAALAPEERAIRVTGFPPAALGLLRSAVIAALEREGYDTTQLSADPDIFRVSKGDAVIDIHEGKGALVIDWTAAPSADVRARVEAGLADARAALENLTVEGSAPVGK